jgi:hypothetical protein
MKDNINPSHYKQGKIEAIDALEAAMSTEQFEGYLKGNVLKYCWRYENKGGVEDLKKAQWYLSKLIEHTTPKEFVHPDAAHEFKPHSNLAPQDNLWSKL